MAFLEHLCEAYQVYTPIDPDTPVNLCANNVAFATQSAPDIRKKLQKLEGYEGMNQSQLVKVDQKVLNNRDTPEEKQDKRMAKVVVAALRETGPKAKGEWKKERRGEVGSS